MAMRDEDRVVVRLSADDRRDLDRLRGPVGRASFLRSLLRRAAREAQDGDRDDARTSLASLAEHDVQVGRVLREIEMRTASNGSDSSRGTDPGYRQLDRKPKYWTRP